MQVMILPATKLPHAQDQKKLLWQKIQCASKYYTFSQDRWILFCNVPMKYAFVSIF